MNDAGSIPQCIQNYGLERLPCENGFVFANIFLDAKNAVADACTGSKSEKNSVKLLTCCYYDTEVDF